MAIAVYIIVVNVSVLVVCCFSFVDICCIVVIGLVASSSVRTSLRRVSDDFLNAASITSSLWVYEGEPMWPSKLFKFRRTLQVVAKVRPFSRHELDGVSSLGGFGGCGESGEKAGGADEAGVSTRV